MSDADEYRERVRATNERHERFAEWFGQYRKRLELMPRSALHNERHVASRHTRRARVDYGIERAKYWIVWCSGIALWAVLIGSIFAEVARMADGHTGVWIVVPTTVAVIVAFQVTRLLVEDRAFDDLLKRLKRGAGEAEDRLMRWKLVRREVGQLLHDRPIDPPDWEYAVPPDDAELVTEFKNLLRGRYPNPRVGRSVHWQSGSPAYVLLDWGLDHSPAWETLVTADALRARSVARAANFHTGTGEAGRERQAEHRGDP